MVELHVVDAVLAVVQVVVLAAVAGAVKVLLARIDHNRGRIERLENGRK